jgi:hypothetical protein
MLRSLTSIKKHILFAPRALARLSSVPSSKTTVILNKISPNVTESSLRDALSSFKHRKMMIEPGCLLHTLNEAEASYCINKLSDNNFQV